MNKLLVDHPTISMYVMGGSHGMTVGSQGVTLFKIFRLDFVVIFSRRTVPDDIICYFQLEVTLYSFKGDPLVPGSTAANYTLVKKV